MGVSSNKNYLLNVEFINIGTFRNINNAENKNNGIYSTSLNENNLNYRFGGKLLIFSPQKNDSIWMSLRTSLGRNNNTNQGYLFTELINTFRFNDMIAFNVSPKYFFSGQESFGGIGVSSYLNLLENVQFIPEIKVSLKNESDFNSSLGLRYSFQPGKSIDLYYSNVVGIQDLGQFLEDKEYRWGIKLNFLY